MDVLDLSTLQGTCFNSYVGETIVGCAIWGTTWIFEFVHRNWILRVLCWSEGVEVV